MKKEVSIAVALLLSAGLFIGCGGGGGGGDTTVKTGTLEDSVVAGVSVECTSGTSTTDNNGKFTYKAGDLCTFKVGGLILGKVNPDVTLVSGSGLVTPADLVGVTSNLVPKAVELSRILQSMDENKNPADGIDLTKKSEELASVNIDLTQKDNFTAEEIINQVSTEANIEVAVVSTVEAENHLQEIENKVKELLQPTQEAPATEVPTVSTDTQTPTEVPITPDAPPALPI